MNSTPLNGSNLPDDYYDLYAIRSARQSRNVSLSQLPKIPESVAVNTFAAGDTGRSYGQPYGQSMNTPNSSIYNEDEDGQTTDLSDSEADISEMTDRTRTGPTMRPKRGRSIFNQTEPDDKDQRKQRQSRKWAANVGFETRLQFIVYDFLNYPSNAVAIFYHLLLFVMFSIYMALLMFTPRDIWRYSCVRYGQEKTPKLFYEKCLAIYFAVEFLARIWSSRSQRSYHRVPLTTFAIRYFSHPAHILDLLILISGAVAASCVFSVPLDFTQGVFILIALRGYHRLFLVVQWTRVKSRLSPWALMVEVFQEQGSELFGLFYLDIMLVMILAYTMFLVEKHIGDPGVNIDDMFDALYWASMTLTTIGYGDTIPVSKIGQAITAICITFGLALFALPGGIIATSFAIKISEQEEIRTRMIRRNKAAKLIQLAWRFVRRQKRFEIACQFMADKETQNVDATLSDNMREELFARIEHIVDHRADFYASQFVQLLLIGRARKQFARLRTPNLRPMMKAYKMERREAIELLDTMRDKVDETWHTLLVPKLYRTQELNLLESKIANLDTLIKRQQANLSSMLSIDNKKQTNGTTEKPANNVQGEMWTQKNANLKK